LSIIAACRGSSEQCTAVQARDGSAGSEVGSLVDFDLAHRWFCVGGQSETLVGPWPRVLLGSTTFSSKERACIDRVLRPCAVFSPLLWQIYTIYELLRSRWQNILS